MSTRKTDPGPEKCSRIRLFMLADRSAVEEGASSHKHSNSEFLVRMCLPAFHPSALACWYQICLRRVAHSFVHRLATSNHSMYRPNTHSNCLHHIPQEQDAWRITSKDRLTPPFTLILTAIYSKHYKLQDRRQLSGSECWQNNQQNKEKTGIIKAKFSNEMSFFE